MSTLSAVPVVPTSNTKSEANPAQLQFASLPPVPPSINNLSSAAGGLYPSSLLFPQQVVNVPPSLAQSVPLAALPLVNMAFPGTLPTHPHAPRSPPPSMSGISLGTPIRIRSENHIHPKLQEYANTRAVVTEIPQHPNTWFGVQLFDGKRVKIRKSAFEVISPRDPPRMSLSLHDGDASPLPHLVNSPTHFDNTDDLSPRSPPPDRTRRSHKSHSSQSLLSALSSASSQLLFPNSNALLQLMNNPSNYNLALTAFAAQQLQFQQQQQQQQLQQQLQQLQQQQLLLQLQSNPKGAPAPGSHKPFSLATHHTNPNSILTKSDPLAKVESKSPSASEPAIKAEPSSSQEDDDDDDDDDDEFQPNSYGKVKKNRPVRRPRNLVGKQVTIENGRYKGQVGLVTKGGNGYYTVQIASKDDKDGESKTVMKRSSDLRLLDNKEGSDSKEGKEGTEIDAADILFHLFRQTHDDSTIPSTSVSPTSGISSGRSTPLPISSPSSPRSDDSPLSIASTSGSR